MPSAKALCAEDEYRHIGAQRQRQLLQALARQPGPPQLVQRQQHGRGIGTAAAQTAAQRQALVEVDIRAQRVCRSPACSSARRAQRQIVGFGNARQSGARAR